MAGKSRARRNYIPYKNRGKAVVEKFLRSSEQMESPYETTSVEKLLADPIHGTSCFYHVYGDRKTMKASSYAAAEKEKPEEISAFADWSDSAKEELRSLALFNLDLVLQIVIKKIVALGHSAEVATKAVMYPRIHWGAKDIFSNIVDNSFARLGETDHQNSDGFKDSKEFEKHLLAEFVWVVKNVSPSSSTMEALWYLLNRDWDVSYEANTGNPPASSSKGKKALKSDVVRKSLISKTKAKRSNDDISVEMSESFERETDVGTKLHHLEKGGCKNVYKRGEGKIYSLGLGMEEKARPSGQVDKITSSNHDGIQNGDSKGIGQIRLDGKDEINFQLLSRREDLKHELEEWTFWGNVKVMQATSKLTMHRKELQSLRTEKMERERSKFFAEENAKKKLSETEDALRVAEALLNSATSAKEKFEEQKSTLKLEMEESKVEAQSKETECQEVSKSLKKALRGEESMQNERLLLQKESNAKKHGYTETQKALMQSKDVLRQLEANWQHELKLKEDLLMTASSIRQELGQQEASSKMVEDALISESETRLQIYKEEIRSIETQIAELSLRSSSSKTKGTQQGCHRKKKRGLRCNRECAMCLSEEVSVVFLPCAHQVLCAECNELHEKNGMNECPSCRCLIQRSIAVRYAAP